MSEQDTSSGAYRARDLAPRYYCMVCYRSARRSPGNCRRCSSPMVSVDEIEVIAELRMRAQTSRNRKVAKEYLLLAIPGAVLGLVFAGFAFATCEVRRGYGSGNPAMPIFAVTTLVGWIVAITIQRAILRAMGRIALSAEKFDAATADVPALLAVLAINVDD